MIELRDGEMFDPKRPSSKGNQLKFQRGERWYKTDYLGYEGLAEVVISKLLRYSNLDPALFVDYEPEQIAYNGRIFNGCSSRDFRCDWQLITLERLFEQARGAGVNRLMYTMENHADRLRFLVEETERLTGLRGFGAYMSRMLAIDTFFLNEDRHSHNIAVLTNARGEFRPAPLFDHAASLLSDTTLDYPLGQDPLELIGKARPKTFCEDFDEQAEIASSLYGEQLRFHFGWREAQEAVNSADIYDEKVRRRVLDLIMERRRKYQILFR